MRYKVFMGIGPALDVLILPLAAMLLLAIVAVFVAFLNRKLARVFATIAAILAGLFLLLILLANDGNVGWVLRVMVKPSPPMFVLNGTLLLSAIAAWAPLRRANGRPRVKMFIAAVGLFLTAVVFATVQRVDTRHGEEKTHALLADRPNAQLRRFQIDHHQRQVICTDPAVLRYLEERIRRHESIELHGWSYELTLCYEGGGTFIVPINWDDDGEFSLWIGEPGEGGTAYGIRLVQPRPQNVDELIRFLSKTDDSGQVLILKAGGSQIERR